MHEEQTSSALSGWSIGLGATRPDQLIAYVEEGFDVAALDHLRARLDLTGEEAAALIRTSPRTLARRQKAGHLSPDESDRLYRLARLFERAVEVLGNEEEARRWLKREQWGLGGAVPLQYAKTEPGAREVETLLDRIDYGVLP